jgi:uncharacterized membrane protein YGL010W
LFLAQAGVVAVEHIVVQRMEEVVAIEAVAAAAVGIDVAVVGTVVMVVEYNYFEIEYQGEVEDTHGLLVVVPLAAVVEVDLTFHWAVHDLVEADLLPHLLVAQGLAEQSVQRKRVAA